MTDNIARDLAAIAASKSVPVLLDIICRTTGMGFSAVARVTDTRWIAAAVRDEIGLGLQPSSELSLETTLCNEVRDSRETIVIEDVATDPGYYAHPTPAMYGFKSYISVPILRADGSFFGTLCALDPAPRPLRKPETLAMFHAYAELIGYHLNVIDREAASEADLLQERKTAALSEQFIAVLGHDLRNPLTAILGGMEMLRKNALSGKAEQWAEMVVSSAGRMAQLIDVVVDFSRSRLGGGLIVEREPCDLLEAGLRRLVAALQPARGQQIVSHIAIGVPVYCDPRRLLQLASNLLNNAVAYGDPEQPIHVAALTVNGWFELEVANAGPPIAPAVLETIFEPFSRGAVQPARQGLGLGLFIAQQIARAHGGAVTVSSTAAQTRFTFRMPVAA